MKKQSIIRISLFFSVVGIILVILLSIYSEPKLISIESINKKQLDNYVKLSGTIINIDKIRSESYLFYIIRLKDDSNSIDLIYNKENELKLNQKIEVVGKISEYKGEIQVETKKIKILE